MRLSIATTESENGHAGDECVCRQCRSENSVHVDIPIFRVCLWCASDAFCGTQKLFIRAEQKHFTLRTVPSRRRSHNKLLFVFMYSCFAVFEEKNVYMRHLRMAKSALFICHFNFNFNWWSVNCALILFSFIFSSISLQNGSCNQQLGYNLDVGHCIGCTRHIVDKRCHFRIVLGTKKQTKHESIVSG